MAASLRLEVRLLRISGVTTVSELIWTLFQGVAKNLSFSLVTNNPTPKFMFLVGFRPLYFENEEK